MEQKSDPLLMLVDDESSTLQALSRVFGDQFRVVCFKNPEEALLSYQDQVFATEGPAIVLADYNLPGQNGLIFLAEVRSRWPQAIRCLFSGQMNSEAIAEALKSGVIHRFFQKPWDNESLRLHMMECLQVHEFLRQTTSDPLTGLLNRKGLLEQLQIEIERAQRHHRPLCLMMMDLDQFKQINDLQGHQAGDLTVIAVAQVLKGVLRNIDLISRFGGDEFIVVLPDTSLDAALTIAERIRSKVEVLQPGSAGFSVSIGLTVLSEKIASPLPLIHQADQALYQAKKLGKNRVEVYPD